MSITIPVVVFGGGKDKSDENTSIAHWGSDNPRPELLFFLSFIADAYIVFYIRHSFPSVLSFIWRDIYAANCVIIPSVYSGVNFILNNNSDTLVS